MDLNELIYKGGKLVFAKIYVPQKNTNRISKLGGEIRGETQIRNLQQQAKMRRERNKPKICLDENRKATQFKQRIKLEEENQNVLAKEWRLKDANIGLDKTNRIGHSKTMKKNSTCK